MNAPRPDGIVWHTSSYSTHNGDCVEVGWRTSSYSFDNGGCVEVALAPGDTLVRDSKARCGPELAFPARSWRAFLATATHPTWAFSAADASSG
ncbi:MAG: DUF397 domain-containing protein [Sciscionella sp.]